ncbi:MAG: NmrA family NAD(P)-binding protein [Saprospiraceae bacterium]|nr:NmrA family NAD(P)-binding protein [Saprospiraceae bacterium]
MNNILVYSATGLQAIPLLSLLQNGENKIYAMTRNRSSSNVVENEYTSVVEVDISDKHQLVKANEGKDVVMLNLPFFSDDNAGKHAIDAAKEAGIKLMIWNANGAIPQETSNRHKINIRLENMERLIASDIPYVVFQPTIYLENLLIRTTAEVIKDSNTIEMITPAEAPIPWMSTWDISLAMVKVVKREDLYNNVFTVSGSGITGTQLAHTFSQVLGRTITYQQVGMEDYIRKLNQVMGEGHGEEIMGMGKRDERAFRVADFPKFSPLDAFEELHFNPMTLHEWITKHKQQFQN